MTGSFPTSLRALISFPFTKFAGSCVDLFGESEGKHLNLLKSLAILPESVGCVSASNKTYCTRLQASVKRFLFFFQFFSASLLLCFSAVQQFQIFRPQPQDN
jgi:hypothetical protein